MPEHPGTFMTAFDQRMAEGRTASSTGPARTGQGRYSRSLQRSRISTPFSAAGPVTPWVPSSIPCTNSGKAAKRSTRPGKVFSAELGAEHPATTGTYPAGSLSLWPWTTWTRATGLAGRYWIFCVAQPNPMIHNWPPHAFSFPPASIRSASSTKLKP